MMNQQNEWCYEPGTRRNKHRWKHDEAGIQSMAKTIRLGRESGILMTLRGVHSPRPEFHLAEAIFTLRIAGHWIWGQPQPTEQRIAWPMVDLLHGLARIWPWLELEEGYPIPITPDHPGKMMQEAEARWRDVAIGKAEAEEDILFDFRQRHDLSLLFRGIHLAPLWLLREGHEALLWSPQLEHPLRLAHSAVMQDLTKMGDGLSAWLATSKAPRAIQARVRWQQRAEHTLKNYLPVIRGMSRADLKAMTGSPDVTPDRI